MGTCSKCGKDFAKENYITWPWKFKGQKVPRWNSPYDGQKVCHVCWNRLSYRYGTHETI